MIDVNSITPKQKLTIDKGLCDYKFIMERWPDQDEDFEEVYYGFYLKARWAVMNLPGNKRPYFDKLYNLDTSDLMEILDDLKDSMIAGSYEFSLGTKLLHTRHPSNPIYDSKVLSYLTEEEHVDFWWHHSPIVRGAASGLSERQKIAHDWRMLNAWYEAFLPSERGREWIEWFDANFPLSAEISNVKKIDFIIFATN